MTNEKSQENAVRPCWVLFCVVPASTVSNMHQKITSMYNKKHWKQLQKQKSGMFLNFLVNFCYTFCIRYN